MLGTIASLALAMAAFVGSHFVLSSASVRSNLVRQFGMGGFRLLYSAIAFVSLAWAILAYNNAPYVELWPETHGLRLVAVAVMPLACIFFVAGVTMRSLTAVGGELLANEPNSVRGALTVTRHPMLWGFGLWAVAHMFPNGDVASQILFGGIGLLAFGGMLHIDQRRREDVGSAWGPIAMTTSVVPFLAAVQGRVQVDWAGIGFPRVLGGLALFVALYLGHELVAGVPVLPGS